MVNAEREGVFMPKLEKVVIAIDTSLEANQLRFLAGLELIKDSDVTLVHLVQDIDYGDGVSFNIAFPGDEDRSKLNHAVLEKLKQLAPQILPSGHKGRVEYDCLFAEDIKDAFCRFLLESRADMAIIASYHHHHIYDVSFGDYVSNRAPCGVMVLKGRATASLRSVVVGVKLDEEHDLAASLSKLDFLLSSDITLLHVSKFQEFGQFSELNFPPYEVSDERLVVEQEVLRRLNNIKEDLVSKGFQGEIQSVCEFSNHPKNAFLTFLENNHFELACTFRGKRRFIRGSFVQYLLHHSDVTTLVLNPTDADTSDLHFHPSAVNRLKGKSDEARG